MLKKDSRFYTYCYLSNLIEQKCTIFTPEIASCLTTLTDHQDVVKLFHAVNLREELVDHRVMHSRAAGARSSLLTDGIQLIKDNYMEATVGPQLKEFQRNWSIEEIISIVRSESVKRL